MTKPPYAPISTCDVSDAPTLPYKNSAIFRDRHVDYGPKSICESEQDSFGDGQVGNIISLIINRNLRSFRYIPITHHPISCLIIGHRRGRRCNVTSCNLVSIFSFHNTRVQMEINKIIYNSIAP